MSDLTWENAEYASGPKLAEWVNSRPGLVDDLVLHFGEQARRTVHRWGHDQKTVPIEAVDRWLTPIGCLLSDLPDDVWTEDRPDYSRLSEEIKEQAVQLRLAGESQAAVARRFGVTPKSVKRWVEKRAA